MFFDILWALVSVVLLVWNYRMAKADGTWSWKLILGFFAALAVFGAGYLWPVINSQWLEAHPDAFVWVIFGPGAVLVAAFYVIAIRVQKAQKARMEAEQ